MSIHPSIRWGTHLLAVVSSTAVNTEAAACEPWCVFLGVYT